MLILKCQSHPHKLSSLDNWCLLCRSTTVFRLSSGPSNDILEIVLKKLRSKCFWGSNAMMRETSSSGMLNTMGVDLRLISWRMSVHKQITGFGSIRIQGSALPSSTVKRLRSFKTERYFWDLTEFLSCWDTSLERSTSHIKNGVKFSIVTAWTFSGK